LVSASRNDAALEHIIGRMSLEPSVKAADWNVEQAAAETERATSIEVALGRTRAANVGRAGAVKGEA
jgi:hypothetical protein